MSSSYPVSCLRRDRPARARVPGRLRVLPLGYGYYPGYAYAPYGYYPAYAAAAPVYGGVAIGFGGGWRGGWGGWRGGWRR